MAKRRSIKHFPYNENYPAWMIRDMGAQHAGSNVEEDTTLWPQKFADAYAEGRKEFFDRKRKKKHGSHDWYVAQLFKAQKVQDIGLRKSLDSDLRKMSKFHRDEIMADFRATYKKWHDGQAGVRRLTTKNPKAPDAMTASQINRRLDSLGKQSSRIMDKLIATGRGREKFQDTLQATDPLARKLQKVNAEYREIQDAIYFRWGPGRTRAPLRNPKRKGTKTMAKKRRTAKQRAATKKMIAANRARLRKKTKTARRKTTGRKKAKRKTRRNPQKARPGLKKSQLWLLFRCVGNKIQYFNGGWPISKQWGPRGSAVFYRTRGHASANAKTLQKSGPKSAIYGAAPKNTTSAKIKEHCDYARGKA